LKTLYIFSDSTATGQHVTLHKTWVHLLSSHLDGRYLVQNASKNGETTRGALERLSPEVLRYEPDIVYIQFGSNDANHWQTDRGLPRVSLRSFRANLHEFIERCAAFSAAVVLGTNHPSFVTGLERYNAAICDVARSVGLPLVDHAGYSGDFLMPDRIHLNECGHRLYFESVKAAMG
jgi:lysophospholipase L1-like esterase